VTAHARTDASVKEMALQITSTAENSTTDWSTGYAYLEDIRDGRGYTGGLVGFTTATSDMLDLVRRYHAERPDNPLAPYLPGLQACADYGDTVGEAEYGVHGGGASDIAAQRLGQPFVNAWVEAARRDPVFRKVQRDLRDAMYWEPARAAATADGVGPLGLALYYDTSVNHGPGVAGSGDGSFDDIRSRATAPTPTRGGDEHRWLRAWLTCRAAVLTEWGDNPPDGRIAMFRRLLDSGNLTLTTPFTWSVYGDTFTIDSPPSPPPTP
jgi:chitosanase